MDRSKDDIITSLRISLEKACVHGIPGYIKRLRANSKCGNFADFYLEGIAAIMFSQAGFDVTLREAPDLALKFNNEQLYAEVTHFRRNDQDIRDDSRMSEPGDLLVPYGDTFPLHGKYACDEVYDKAGDKIKQYKEHVPNILVIESSSACIDDIEIPSAIDMINEDVRSGKCMEFAKLNGILLITVDCYNVSQRRNVFFYPTCNSAVPLSLELCDLLNQISFG